MDTLRVAVALECEVKAATLYGIVADYRDGHPRILPRPPFVSLEVESGGVGAGTRIRCSLRAYGRTRTLRAAISEPEPGRVLVETEDGTGVVTTFTVEPIGNDRSRVTIETVMPTRGGPLGAIERWLSRRFLKRTYARELERLYLVATGRA